MLELNKNNGLMVIYNNRYTEMTAQEKKMDAFAACFYEKNPSRFDLLSRTRELWKTSLFFSVFSN